MLIGNLNSPRGVHRGMKAPSLVAAVVTALAFAGVASAKEPISATVCGARACKTLTDKERLRGIPSGETTRPLGPAVPYYRIEILMGGREDETHSFALYYIPEANGTAWLEDGSMLLHPIFGEPTKLLMRKMTEGLEPYPAPRITSVRVGDRTVTGTAAQQYLRLFSEPARRDASTQSGEWLHIDLRSARRSPWTDAPHEFLYSREDDALVRGWHVVKLDARTAANIERGRALDADTGPSRRLLLAALAGVPALGLLGLFALRRRGLAT
jgi:hypothetical protein